MSEIKERPGRSSAGLAIGMLICFVAAFGLRFYQLDLRPLHPDEAVNYHFIGISKKLGFYPYSHQNFHGPSFFYLLWFVTYFAGDGAIALRLAPAMLGCLMIFPLLALRRSQGFLFVFLGGLLLSLSPSLVFFSRSAIHEVLFVFITLCMGVSVFCWVNSHSIAAMYCGWVALGLLAATKETFLINTAVLVMAAAACANPFPLWRRLSEQRTHCLYGACACLAVIYIFYTGAFQNGSGVREFLLGLLQWPRRGVSDAFHIKPLGYYFGLLGRTEAHCLCAVGVSLCSLAVPSGRLLMRREPFLRFSSAWAGGSLLIYSAIPYKTPWLVLNITVPGILCAAWWLSYALRREQRGVLKAAVLTASLGLALVLCELSIKFDFLTPSGPGNPYSYLDTRPGAIRLAGKIRDYAEIQPQAPILVAIPRYWPLPYYLRNYAGRVDYVGGVETLPDWKAYGVVIVPQDLPAPDDQWTAQTFRILDNQWCRAYFKRTPPSPGK